jgi:uncharacterized protein
VGPFAAFIAVMVIERAIPIPSGWLYPMRAVITLAALLLLSRPIIPWRPSQAIASVVLGVAVFAVWIGPDLLWPGFRTHWLFRNAILGAPDSTLPDELKGHTGFLTIRIFGSVGLVPIIEELFWRGWLMRWVIKPQFWKVPLGAYTPFSFWVTAVLFASEHGSYWDVGLLAGIIYNWWMLKTRNLADCILAHAVTNGCLAAYVLVWGQWQYWL